MGALAKVGLSNVAPPHISARLEINKDQKQSQGFQDKIALKHQLHVRLTHPKKRSVYALSIFINTCFLT